MRPPADHGTPDGDPTERELAAIARHLRDTMPSLRTAAPTKPLRRPPANGRAMMLFLAGSLVPALVVVAILLAFGPQV